MDKNRVISNSVQARFRVEAGNLEGRPRVSYCLIRTEQGLALDLGSEIGRAAFEQMLARLKRQPSLLPGITKRTKGNNRLHLSWDRKEKEKGGKIKARRGST